MTARLRPPSGGDDAPVRSARVGARGPSLDLVALAEEVCRRYRVEFPDEKRRYGAAGNAWCLHDNQHLLNWGVESVNGDLDIIHEVSWLANVLESRGFPPTRLARNLEIGAEVVIEHNNGPAGKRLSRVLTDTARFVQAHGTFLDADVATPVHP
jgi:hypothetical protein